MNLALNVHFSHLRVDGIEIIVPFVPSGTFMGTAPWGMLGKTKKQTTTTKKKAEGTLHTHVDAQRVHTK